MSQMKSSMHTVRDFIPSTHSELPILRLYLPFLDAQEEPVRWSQIATVDHNARTMNWAEFSEESILTEEKGRGIVPSRGVLDATTAEALRSGIEGLTLECLRWVGYSNSSGSRVHRNGEEYYLDAFSSEDLRAGRRIPEFVWDAEGKFAWGARLYPDSMVVAAELKIFRTLLSDTRLDAVSVRSDDVFPWSAGD